jgi:FkbM family methyltransferase
MINLIDVGSAGGLEPPWREHKDKIKHVLNFEPRDEPVQNGNILTINTALWNEECQKEFRIYKGFRETGSSFFEQNHEYVKKNYRRLRKRGNRRLVRTWHNRSQLIEKIVIQCRKLDDVLADLPQKYDFLKIDAQGAEYQILEGASNFLKDCVGLHLELFTIPLYKDIKLFDDVVSFVEGFGFNLVKKYPATGTFASQNDCVFLKDDAPEIFREIYGVGKNKV